MDFGLVGLGNFSVSNNNGSENGSEANDKQKWCGSGFLKQGRVIHEDDYLRDFKLAKTNNMLSFSSPNSQSTMALPFHQHTSTALGKNTGMYGVISGLRAGPFTASQWMELEHQALIYKYIDANVPIPSYLLNPIRKALESAGFLGLRSNALWGGFQLGFSSNCDPEPGRCRRTDGKKWRCSRDAVVDQKYCERHMNRGRHRSRKPVEGQPGHSVTGITNTAVKPSPNLSSAVSAGGLSHRQLDGIPTSNRNIHEKERANELYQHTTVLSRNSPPKISLNDNPLYSIPKHQNESTCSEFGLVCSDSLLNPLDRRSSLVNHNPSDEIRSQHSLRQFIDEDLPRNLSEPSSGIPWLHTTMPQQNRTQLSIAIPSDFMGLGIVSDQTQKQNISWESSMGGPLGEVLHPTTNELNLMDNNSSRLVTSPTGVLQSCAFRSVSSSAGNSPRG